MPELQDIVDQIRLKSNPLPVPKIESFAAQDKGYGRTYFDVPKEAVYDRLPDGSFAAKYENYKGAIGNEDRLARQQSGLEQIGSGLAKNATKMVNYALDATVGTVYGIYNGIANQDFSAVWDNDFSRTMDEWNTSLDRQLPNYYTDEQKSMGFLRSMGTTNFWFNDVANGLAFVGGALIPEIAIGALTGGASVAPSFGKLALRGAKETGEALFKKSAKKAVKESIESVNGYKAKDLIRGWERANFAKKSGDVASTAGFLFRTSNFEAGMEARHNFKDAISTYLTNFEDKNGRAPTLEEMSNFTDDARKTSNMVYTANLAILSISNAAMFGKAFGLKTPSIGKRTSDFANRAIGLGTKTLEDGTRVLRGANRAQKIAGNTYKVLSKPLIEGVYEEGLQGVSGKMMQNYLEQTYDPNSVEPYSVFSGLTDAMSEQYGTREGWKEIGIGMLIGFAGGAVTGQGMPGIGRNSRKAREQQIQTELDASNQGLATLKGLDRSASVRNFSNVSKSGETKFYSTSAENTLANVNFIRSQEHLKTAGEIKKDFDLVVDKMEFDSDQVERLNLQGTDVDIYKKSLKDEFERNRNEYRFAKRAAESVGLDKALKNTPGNIEVVKEAMMMNLIMGKDALASARNIASQIEQVIRPAQTGGLETAPSGGVFDYLQFYNNLSGDKKTAVKDLKQKQRRIKELTSLGVKYQQEIAGAKPMGSGRKLSDDKLQQRYQQAAEKAVLNQTQIVQLEGEIQSLVTSLNNDFAAVNYDMDATATAGATDILRTLDKLDTYKTALRENGKAFEAESIDYLTTQFKIFSDAHREMMNTHRNMLSTGFFQSQEGQRLTDRLVGKKYQMSPELIALIKENDDRIDDSLNIAGIRGYATVQEKIKEAIEDNEQLSEREKFRLESILRLQLSADALNVMISDATSIDSVFNADKRITRNPLEGDTVILQQALDIKSRNLDNIDVLNKTIKEITDQLDFIRKAPDTTIEVKELNDQLDELLARKKQIQDAIKESEKQQQEGDQQNDNSQREGTDQGQQQEVQAEESQADNRYSDITNQEEIDTLIDQVKQQIANKSADFKMVDSPDYIRMTELMQKRELGNTSSDEFDELSDLEADINEWFMLSGVIIDGYRLTDLIRQKIVLEGTPVVQVEQVEETTPQEIIDTTVNFDDRSGNVNYSLAQSYEAVTAIRDGDFVAVSGIKPENLIQEIGFDFQYDTNERGNILLTDDTVNRVNQESPVSILPTNQELTTSYSVVLLHKVQMDDSVQSLPLRTNYTEDFTEEMNLDAIYSLNPDSPLTFEVDPNDKLNRELLDTYRSASGSIELGLSQDDYEEQVFEELLRNDVPALDLDREAKILEIQIKDAKTTTETAALRKKLFNVNERLGKREDTIRSKVPGEIIKRSRKANPETVSNVREELRRRMVIRVKDGNGNFIGVLKAKRENGKKSPVDEQFDIWRDNVVSSDLLDLLQISEVPVEITKTAKTKKVYLGHPNFNFVKNEDGSVVIKYRRIQSQDVNKILDIGFISEGRVNTKMRVTGIDTTFLSKSMSVPTKRKIPFVVIQKGTRQIAYPVRLIEQSRPDNQEIIDVFNSDSPVTTKVTALNKLLAARGVDIKQPGNAFIGYGQTNLTDEFLDEKLQQIDAIKYFDNIDNWLDSKTDMSKVVTEQMLINIDLSNPVHSPKFSMDFTETFTSLQLVSPDKSTYKAADQTIKKGNKKVASKGLELLQKKC